jgi:ribosomal protein L29|tara:strand:+ start:9648 stop:10253 length:606 start_codon:yes stop_codon:yes gene_type:complete
MKNKEDVQFVDKVIGALRKTATEIEEFRVQTALGKAEAQDKFEEVKKKFNLFVHDSEYKIKGVKEKIDELNAKFDELRVQLALGKAETKEIFKKQKKQLLLTLHDIEVKIKTNETLNRMYALTLIEIEQFKIQLEILEQKFNKEKVEAKDTFEKGKKDFNAFVEKLKGKYAKKKEEETKLEHFQSEISEAFTHFKNAFSKP